MIYIYACKNESIILSNSYIIACYPMLASSYIFSFIFAYVT